VNTQQILIPLSRDSKRLRLRLIGMIFILAQTIELATRSCYAKGIVVATPGYNLITNQSMSGKRTIPFSG